MANRRVWYASHAVGIAPLSSNSFTFVHGAQSVGVNANFTLENVQELGQITVYQLVEQIPEIEVTLEKVLDGYCPMYCLATQGAGDPSLAGRSNQRCGVAVSVYSDIQSSASGTPTSEVFCSGLYWQQIGWNFDTTTSFKESLTLVGNDKTYLSSGFTFQPTINNNDVPLALPNSGGVQIRKDLIFYPVSGVTGYAASKEQGTTLDSNGQIIAFYTILPPDITGISSSGTNDRDSSGGFNAHVQSITVGCNVGRDSVLELGRKEPYARFATFPIQVTCGITIIATQADSINASELGLDGFGNNAVPRSIKIRAREGTYLNLGTNNKLTTVSLQGGNTDGGQKTVTYNYINYNDLIVTHPNDISQFTWPY